MRNLLAGAAGSPQVGSIVHPVAFGWADLGQL